MYKAHGVLSWILAALVQPLAAAHAQPLPELLLPVSQDALDHIESASKDELERQVHFAKRYRVVQINFDVLQRQDASFTISAFPELTLQAQTIETHGPSSTDQLQEWTGQLMNAEQRRIAVDTGRELPPPRIHLWIRSGAHEVPLRAARDIARSGAPSTFGPRPGVAEVSADDARAVTKVHLQSLSGEWFVPTLVNDLVIRPLDGDPRFHLIYEKDRDKFPRP